MLAMYEVSWLTMPYSMDLTVISGGKRYTSCSRHSQCTPTRWSGAYKKLAASAECPVRRFQSTDSAELLHCMKTLPHTRAKDIPYSYWWQFIPIQVAGIEVPRQLFDWIAVATQLQYEIDKPATELAVLIARFLQISAFVEAQVLSDGRPKTSNAIRQLLDLDADLAAWVGGLKGEWVYQTGKAPHLSQRALFRGEYHVYHDVLIARTWNYFRWARILVNQILIDLVDKSPVSSLPLVSVARRSQAFRVVRKLAKETLVSTPSHWKHPLLEDSRITVENAGGGGAGAAGVPALIFQLKVASCAPGIPFEYWQWALDAVTTVWGDMGMLYARIVIEAMRAHQDNVQRSGADGILAEEW